MKVYRKTRREYKEEASRGKCWRFYCMIEGKRIDTCDIDITTLVFIGYYNPSIKLKKYICEEQKIHSYDDLFTVMNTIRPESEKSTKLLENVIANLNGEAYFERIRHLAELQERSSKKPLNWSERHSVRLDILKKLCTSLTKYTLSPEPIPVNKSTSNNQSTNTPIRIFSERTK